MKPLPKEAIEELADVLMKSLSATIPRSVPKTAIRMQIYNSLIDNPEETVETLTAFHVWAHRWGIPDVYSD